MSPTLVVIRPPGLGLRPTSTSTFLALVTLSPDPSLTLIGGLVAGVFLSCDRGGRRKANPLRADASSRLDSNDVTEVTELRCLSLCELQESKRSRETLVALSGEFEAHLTFTVTLDCWVAMLDAFSLALSFSKRCLYSRRNAFVALLPDWKKWGNKIIECYRNLNHNHVYFLIKP